jgi:chromate transporter
VSAPATANAPSLAETVRIWAAIGLLSFGGPTAQIALMHRVIVDEKRWLSEERYLGALSFCMLLPGPEAMQLATYVGWRLRGTVGGLVAGLLFVLPGALVVLALASTYAVYGNVGFVEAAFLGIKAAVLIIVVEALSRIAKRALKRWDHWAIAAISFSAIFFFATPFPVIVIGAALVGFLRGESGDAATESAGSTPIGVKLTKTFATIAVWLAIWLLPLAGIAAVFGPSHLLTQLGLFFSKLAVVTFGGAYAVLAYMAQTVVVTHGWVDAGEMMDGLGLAEATPGPLILVTEFVGFLAGFKHEGGPAFVMGLLGALVALWMTFVPCFLWIFAGAPYIEWLNSQPRLKEALSAITAAVVGVILNLAVWFALHVFFGKVAYVEAGPLKLWVPEAATLDWRVVVFATVSGFLLLCWRWKIPSVLAVAALLSLSIQIIAV